MREPSSQDRRELRTVALALLASLLLWNLPFGGVLLYPFKLLATWLHELSHGVAMLGVRRGARSRADLSRHQRLGRAKSAVDAVGSAVIAAAGYMGTPLWGALFLVVARDARAARRALFVLAVLLVTTALTVVSDTPQEGEFGRWAIVGIGVVIALCGVALPPRLRLLVAHFIAAQACVNALLDIRVLLRPCRSSVASSSAPRTRTTWRR